jgi:hypothetical protein
MANNKVLIRDNLAKRKHLDDKTCMFYEEAESVTHIFYCIVAQALWVHCAEITGYPIISHFESLGRFWVGQKVLCYEYLYLYNVMDFVEDNEQFLFSGAGWRSLEVILAGCTRLVRSWAILSKPKDGLKLKDWVKELGRRSLRGVRASFRIFGC